MNLYERSFALFRAAMVYDFKNGMQKLCKFLRDDVLIHEVNTKTDHAFIYAPQYSVLNIDIMGTGGESIEEKIAAWKRDFEMEPDADGLPAGFSASARYILNSARQVFNFERFSRIDVVGHSAGASVASAFALKAIKETVRPRFQTTVFAGPPDGNYKVANFYRTHCQRWKQIKVVNPRDIVTQILRDQEEKEKRGVDIGEILTLPPDTTLQRLLYKWFKGFPSFIEHSPKEYCDGLMKIKPDPFLKLARGMMVN